MDLRERELRRCWNADMTAEEAAKHLTLQRRCGVEDPIEAQELASARFAIYEQHLGDKSFPAYCLMGGYFSDKSGVIAKELGAKNVTEGLAKRSAGKLKEMLREVRVTEVRAEKTPAPAPTAKAKVISAASGDAPLSSVSAAVARRQQMVAS